MKIKRSTVNIGDSCIYIEVYDKYDENTGKSYVDTNWKTGDVTFEKNEHGWEEKVFDGNGWVLHPPLLSVSICSYFFKDIEEASKYVTRILNNDPTFNESEYLKQKGESDAG